MASSRGGRSTRNTTPGHALTEDRDETSSRSSSSDRGGPTAGVQRGGDSAEIIRARLALIEAEARAAREERDAKREEREREREDREHERNVRREEREREIEHQERMLEIERKKRQMENEALGERVRLEREAATAGGARSASSASSDADGPATGRDRHHLARPRDLIAPMPEESPDVPGFFSSYELACEVHGIPRDQWHIFITPLLNAKARMAHARLGREGVGDYAKVKEAVLDHFRLTPEAYLQQFRSASRAADESYAQLAVRMRDIQGYYIKARGIETLDDLLEDMLAEQLKDSLPAQVREYVEDKRPESVESITELCDHWIRLHPPQDSKRTWRGNSQSQSSQQQQSSQSQGSHRTRAVDHRQGTRPTVASAGAPALSTGKGPDTSVPRGDPKPGIRDKGQVGANSGKGNSGCYKCGQTTHFARECPNRDVPRASANTAAAVSR
jgi:hypothetical protein